MDWNRMFSVLFDTWQDSKASSEKFWEKALAVNQSIDFPTDKIGKVSDSYFYSFIESEFSEEQSREIKRMAADNACPGTYPLFLTAFLILITRYTQNETVFTVPFCMENGNEHLTFISADLPEEISFAGMLKGIAEINKNYGDKIKISTDQFRHLLKTYEDKNWPFLLETSFSYINKPKAANGDKQDLYDCGRIFKSVIHFQVLELEKGFTLKIGYRSDLFENDSVFRMGKHFQNIMMNGICRPDVNIFRMEILDTPEKELLISEWNNTRYPFPEEKCLHQLFEEKAMENPEAPAVFFKGAVLSRGELNQKANQVAHYLLGKGVKRNEPIGIYIDKSFEMVVGLMGILKAGCAYLPIDSSYPVQRLQYMLNDANVKLLITQSELKKNVPVDQDVETILMDEEWDKISTRDSCNPDTGVTPDDLCYIIYTSGSTGDPKGVMLDHKGRVNNFNDFNTRFSVNAEDKVLAVSSLSFDMCAYDVFGILAAGASIVLPEPSLATQPIHWLKLIHELKVTVWHSVPVMLELLCKCAVHRKKMDIGSLRLILLGGDWIPVYLPDELRKINAHCEIISLGGATEVSMDSIIYFIGEVLPEWTSIPYGRPMYNQLAYILDKRQELLPIGVPGELYLGGIGVGEGYYNKAELTSEKFLPNKWCGDPEGRIYKTGDLARFFPDGTIQLLGRMDFQVKINGVRIELGEIEACLKKHPLIENSVTLAIEYEHKKKKIVGFVIPKKESGEISPALLRKYLKENLPEHFVPSDFIVLDSLPTTPNGKIDRKKLKDIANSYCGDN